MVSTDDLLDLRVPTRHDGFRFDLLDSQHRLIGQLDAARDTPAQVQLDTTRTSFRMVNNLHVTASDLNAIDIIHDRVRPVMILEDGAQFPLGVFMFGDDARALFSWGIEWTPTLFDEAFILDQGTSIPYGARPGDSLLALVNAVLAPFNLPSISIEVPDAAVPGDTPLSFPAGSTTSYQILATLAPLLSAFPPFFDGNGTFTFKALLRPGQPTPDDIYESGQLSRILDGTPNFASSAYKAPNQWIVVGGTTTDPVIGIYDLPASSPNSITQRGYLVQAPTITMQGVDASVANLAAFRAAITDRNAYGTARFDGSIDPRHGTFDVVQFMGDMYLETGWQIQCASGGAHTHNLTRLWW